MEEEPQVLTRWQDPTIEQLQKENKQLKEDKKKAIEYIKSYLPNYDFDHSNLEKLLEILGDKE